ncbi:hypothetical protein [Nevskia sp.]|uniref:hypothetical protein n=1 Tax=Nevskia sp. TaxID=1929292 RepID=UPI0025D7A8BD|nr:hypothetical protein [Nevskia sp.]
MSLYWRVFNFLVRRVVALAFLAGGITVAIINGTSLMPDGTVNVEGAPSTDMVMRLVAVVLPLVVAGLGVLLFRVPPFNPEENRNVQR